MKRGCDHTAAIHEMANVNLRQDLELSRLRCRLMPLMGTEVQEQFLALILSENRAHQLDTVPPVLVTDAWVELDEAVGMIDAPFSDDTPPAAQVVQLAILGAAALRMAEMLMARCTPGAIEKLQSGEEEA